MTAIESREVLVKLKQQLHNNAMRCYVCDSITYVTYLLGILLVRNWSLRNYLAMSHY